MNNTNNINNKDNRSSSSDHGSQTTDHSLSTISAPNPVPRTPTPERIAIIGLGYVGLPLARLFATKYPVIGFDINQARIDELNGGHDSTLEVEDDILQAVLVSSPVFSTEAERSHSSSETISATSNPLARQTSELEPRTSSELSEETSTLAGQTSHLVTRTSSELSEEADTLAGQTPYLEPRTANGLFCSSQIEDIATASIYIITVPTPVDKHNKPDLTPLYKASETVGKVLKKGDIVIYESTVYPGATEEECVPVLEKVSGLKFNEDFFVGYSPERINPGDKERTVEKILKVTSGSTPEIGIKVDELYKSVIPAGTHLAPSIKVAEAAKVIENSQRDINIAFVNELAKIFNILEIDTHAVLEAAGTKWNFLPFKPGLVGGHCIGVDPYYLAQKAQEHGYHPEIILAGRRLNDSMGAYVASEVVKCMIKKGINVSQAEILILGITFKENCPDVRNTRIVDVISALKDYGVKVSIYDPWANPEEVMREYGLKLETNLDHHSPITDPDHPSPTTDHHLSTLSADHSSPSTDHQYDAVVLTVAHNEFLEMNISNLQKKVSVLYDVKGILSEDCDGRL